jgi:hypothetical protein
MTPEMIALAQRAVACKGWRWMPGMRVLGGDRITERTLAIDHGCLPDLTDAATMGCLLALAREAWGDECACVLPIDYGPAGVRWVARLTAGGRSLTERYWPTEAEALVAALEAAP